MVVDDVAVSTVCFSESCEMRANAWPIARQTAAKRVTDPQSARMPDPTGQLQTVQPPRELGEDQSNRNRHVAEACAAVLAVPAAVFPSQVVPTQKPIDFRKRPFDRLDSGHSIQLSAARRPRIAARIQGSVVSVSGAVRPSRGSAAPHRNPLLEVCDHRIGSFAVGRHFEFLVPQCRQ